MEGEMQERIERVDREARTEELPGEKEVNGEVWERIEREGTGQP